MGEKSNHDGESKKNKNGDEGSKKEATPTTLVLKIDMHCEGCATKIIKRVRGFEGVETVRAELDKNKLTVTGFVDPSKVRERLAEKTKKKVDLISPQPKKDDNKNDSNQKNSKKSDDKSEKKDAEDKKTKELPVTTAVLKVDFHCEGCVQKIRKIVSKTKGIHDMTMDREKETMTVKGTMDVKALTQNLTEKLKRKVEVAQPKKKESGDGGQKEGGNAGAGDGGKKKKKGGGGEDEGEGNGGNGSVDGAKVVEGARMEYMSAPWYSGAGYHYGYGHVYVDHLHAPQMFSDENPHACSIM